MIELLPEKIRAKPQNQPRVLIVEDSESILLAIHDYLLPHYQLYLASSLWEGWTILQEKSMDLVVCDINLQDGKGFELLAYTRCYLPHTKIILITAYDINNYLDILARLEVEVVISKHGNLSLSEIYVAAQKLLSQDIFGVEKYFPDIRHLYLKKNQKLPPLRNHEIQHVTIENSWQRAMLIDQASQTLAQQYGVPEALSKLVLDEISTNAMYRAPRKADGSYKYQRYDEDRQLYIPDWDVELEKEDFFTLSYGIYDDYVIFAAKDSHGTLSKKEILYRLRRHGLISPRTGLPEGISDTHGRGIFLLRESLSHLIFNINKKRCTEVLCFYNKKSDSPYKNISIFEVESHASPCAS
ncbi:MAG: response regulator [Leptospiraceae bacterium]|nr:response regulator [Leptospiraceae bacterium]MDW8307320.1 response regulator [Leptospiraceae bacterium]